MNTRFPKLFRNARKVDSYYRNGKFEAEFMAAEFRSPSAFGTDSKGSFSFSWPGYAPARERSRAIMIPAVDVNLQPLGVGGPLSVLLDLRRQEPIWRTSQRRAREVSAPPGAKRRERFLPSEPYSKNGLKLKSDRIY
jgi:hypothetical protein